MDPRPEWDDYFMNLAMLASTRSTCLIRKVGAIAVKDKHVLATGYNGAPKGILECIKTECAREGIEQGKRQELCMATHAEQNLIAQSAKFGISLDNSTIYCTNYPCSLCTKMLINAGIKEIVYLSPYDDPLTKKLLDQTDIRLRQIKVPDVMIQRSFD